MTYDSGSFRLEQRQEVAKGGPQTEIPTLFGSAHIKGSITITIDILGFKSTIQYVAKNRFLIGIWNNLWGDSERTCWRPVEAFHREGTFSVKPVAVDLDLVSGDI